MQCHTMLNVKTCTRGRNKFTLDLQEGRFGKLATPSVILNYILYQR